MLLMLPRVSLRQRSGCRADSTVPRTAATHPLQGFLELAEAVCAVVEPSQPQARPRRGRLDTGTAQSACLQKKTINTIENLFETPAYTRRPTDIPNVCLRLALRAESKC